MSVFIEAQTLLVDVDQDEPRQLGNSPDVCGKDLRYYGKVEGDIDEPDVCAQVVQAANYRHGFKPVDKSDPLSKKVEIVIEILHEAAEVADRLPLRE